MTSPFTIDGQRAMPLRQPMAPLDFRNLDLPSACHEIPFELWAEEAARWDDFPRTVPMEFA